MKSNKKPKKNPAKTGKNQKKDRDQVVSSSRAKKLIGAKGIWVLPEPVSIFPLEKEGIKLTEISFASHLPQIKPIAVDEVFAAFLNMPKTAIDPLPWLAIKPWLDNTQEEVDEFWNAFNTAVTIQERMWCFEGDKQVTWANERLVIDQVLLIKDLTNTEKSNPELILMLQMKLAEWVMGAVESNPQSLRRLYTLLKKPQAITDLTNRERINREVFSAFIKLVATHKKLPTKKQVEEASFLGKEKRMKSRALLELGLNGLPEAPKSSK